jgi:hypothetical protein
MIQMYLALQLLDHAKHSMPPNFDDYKVVCEFKNDNALNHSELEDGAVELVHQQGMSMWNPSGPMKKSVWVTFDIHAPAGTNFANVIRGYMEKQGMPGSVVFLGSGDRFMAIPESVKSVSSVLIVQGDLMSVKNNFHTKVARY